MSQAKVHGVICPKRSAKRHPERVAVDLSHARDHFVKQVLFVLHMSPGATTGVRPAAVPALAIDAIHTDQLDPSIFDVLPKRAYHAAVFKFIEAALRRW